MADGDDFDAVAAPRGCGMLAPGEAATLTPLGGGVSCDVWRVDAGGRSFVAKRALPRLRVAAEWLASPDRALSEVRWLRRARAIDPRLAPEVLAEVPAANVFAIEYLEPATHPVWKDELFAGRVHAGFAEAVGRDLARLHAASADDAVAAAEFATDALFEALRIEPFLRHVAARDAGVADRLGEIAGDLTRDKRTLVHGDVSPKNILAGPHGPVFLDAECAVFGDPAFDIAFCITHLLLKAVALPESARALRNAATRLWSGYARGIDWEPVGDLSRRAGPLIAALLLARVDGKSPVPYLDAERQAVVRARARRLLGVPVVTVEDSLA